MTEPILGFTGQYRFLSNFYPVKFIMDGVEYHSSEQAYMIEKSTDPAVRAKIMAASTAGRVKRLCQGIKLRADWDEKYRNAAMLRALIHKFSVPEMRQLLAATGDAHLEETNFHGDTYWGVCEGEGKNMLGRMLMYVRDRNESI